MWTHANDGTEGLGEAALDDAVRQDLARIIEKLPDDDIWARFEKLAHTARGLPLADRGLAGDYAEATRAEFGGISRSPDTLTAIACLAVQHGQGVLNPLDDETVSTLHNAIELALAKGGGTTGVATSQQPHGAPAAPEPILDVEFKERIGQGASANVWRAIERDLSREVAVKLLLPGGDCFQRTLAHAKALARVSHKNVVTVYRIAKLKHPETMQIVDGIVLELLRGKTLADRLNEGKLSVQEVTAIGGGILDGLEHIHGQQLEHGDLHEGNVMVVEDGGVKILDIVGGDPLDELSTISRETKLRRDLANLKQMLVVLVSMSDAQPTAAQMLALRQAQTLAAMREAFGKAAVTAGAQPTPSQYIAILPRA